MSNRQQKTVRQTGAPFRSALFLLLACASCLFLTAKASHAERKYALGGQVDLLGGLSNTISNTFQGSGISQDKLWPFYGAIPSLDFTTEGINFDLYASYGTSFQQYRQDETITTRSHTVDAWFSPKLGDNLQLTVSNYYFSTPDYLTYRLTRNIVLSEDRFVYAYTPEPLSNSFKSNVGNLALDWYTGPQSRLTFTAGGGFRTYGNSADPSGLFNNQVRYSGSLGYSRQSSEYTTWNVRYEVYRNEYQDYGNSLSHNALIGFSHQIRPTVMFKLEGGPSYVVNSGADKSYPGYIGDIRITKSSEFSQFSAFASHRSGDSSGIGYVSDISRAGLGFSFRPGRFVNVAFTSSAYRSIQRHEDPLDTWGVNAGAQLSWLISRYVRAGFGASYRRNEGNTVYNRDYKQLYVSISLTAPEFWETMQ